MVETAYAETRFRPQEIAHRYGPSVHLLDDPLAWTQLARLCARATVQPEVGRLVRVLYERLAYWVGKGAQLSERVEKVVKAHKKASAAAAA